MIGVWNGLRALAGDALVAVGTALADQAPAFDEQQAADYLAGRWESDGPDTDRPAATEQPSDAELLRTAAQIISGWKSILLRGAGSVYDPDELDEFVALLRDRAAQVDALELVDPDDDPQPHPLAHAADFFPRHRNR